eukprot:TRINITY_DN281_c0_g2_i1.p1 TRINITY_DN281_c0_g2~~TRINITY_DN281_c0_g2_i1.p1  ORF type:complete len:386 (+),score=127.86 TRINITY_DN281_c0_g2_i1:27-1184(+)
MQDDSGVLIKQVYELNKKNLELWEQLLKNNSKSKQKVSALLKLAVKTTGIYFIYGDKEMASDLGDCFYELKNLFKDKLPTNQYYDLTNILDKYKNYLVPKSQIEYFTSWKETLQNVQHYLGNIEGETKITASTIKEIFKVPKDESVIRLKRKEERNFLEVQALNFDIDCSRKKIEDILEIREFVYRFYEPIDYQNKPPLFDGSKILDPGDVVQFFDWVKDFEKVPNQGSELLYRASTDGFQASKFHEKCDTHKNTVTFVKSTNGSIFGGFTPLAWSSNSAYSSDTEKVSFLFTLKNPSKKKQLFKHDGQHAPTNTIYGGPNYGPTFGGGHDLYIADNSNQNKSSSTNLGHNYGCSPYTYNSRKSKKILCGSQTFQTTEIEVWELN